MLIIDLPQNLDPHRYLYKILLWETDHAGLLKLLEVKNEDVIEAEQAAKECAP
jgi:hypothetical protein